MPETVRHVAKIKDPAFVALMTILLRWPDRTLAAEYVVGHKIVGHIEAAKVFRPLPTNEITQDEFEEGFLGKGAKAFIDSIVNRPPGKDAEVIQSLM